jgi:hypothetical protein
MNRPRIRAGTAAQKEHDMNLNKIDTSKMPPGYGVSFLMENPADENQGRGPAKPAQPSPLGKAFRAAWRAFWRELEIQRRINNLPDPLK